MTDDQTIKYSGMPIEDLMDEYAMLAKDPLVIDYINIGDELMRRRDRNYSNKPETEFYKAVCGYEYTIDLPYDELYITFNNAWIKHHDYSFKYKDPDGKTYNTCLSLCGYSRDKIIEMIEKRIKRLENGGADD